MSTLPDNELDLDKLFLPAWAQEPASARNYEHYQGGDERPDRRGARKERGPGRPHRGPSDRRPGGPGGDRRGPRREGGERRPFDRQHAGPRREAPRMHREAPAPLPEVALAFLPEEKGVESLARQIKMTGRAYPLFDIARLILQKPDRHLVRFSVKKDGQGQVVQPLFVCALDDTLWLSEDAAIGHVLKNHFATFYQAERTATEPPKGKYTFVAQCGMSGVILGPPNYHDYQNQLRRLHTQRFSRMPFEAFKSRVKIVRDEEVVKKWVEDQSWKTEYVCLNLPEPLRLDSREAVEKHFRENHKETIIKAVEAQTMTGTAARDLRSPELARLVRQSWEDQRRFPLQIATVLSQQFASHGLQFFKVNKAITHVCVARPHFLDLETTPVSEGVRRIVTFIDSNPKCTRRKLVESLAPAPVAPPAVSPSPTSSEAATPAESAPAPGAEAAPSASPATPPAATPAAAPATNLPTPEQTAVIADLHWLIHQGHVIEFANGIIETAKKPLPKPPKPAPAAPKGQPESNASVSSPSVAPDAAPESPAPASQESIEPAGAVSEPAIPEPPAEQVTPGDVENPGTPSQATEERSGTE